MTDLPSMVVQVEGRCSDEDLGVIFTDYAVSVPRVGDDIYVPAMSRRRGDTHGSWVVSKVEWQFGRRPQDAFQTVVLWLKPQE
jgi:hypothetical protein